MPPQILHEIAGQFLNIHHVILDSSCKGQTLADLHIIELRPQNAGRVQQFQRPIHRHPLLGAGHAGAILRLGGLAVGHLIDKGGFAHVGNAQHHHPDSAAHLSFFSVGGQLVLQKLADGGGKLRRAHAALGVGLQHRVAFSPEIGGPALRLSGVSLIHAVQHHQPGLARRHFVHVGIAAGQRDTGIQYLAHRVHILDLGHDHALGFRHMAGEPAQSFYLHGVSPRNL